MTTLLSRFLSIVERFLGRGTADPAKVKQVLILEYLLPLGCCVHLTPVFEAIARCRPDIRIILATRGAGIAVNRYSPWLGVLLETPDPLKDFGACVRSLRKQLADRGLRPDCVLTGVSDQRTRITLLALLSSTGWRGGFTLKPGLYQRPLLKDASISQIQNNLQLAGLLHCQPIAFEPHVAFTSGIANHVRNLLLEINPSGRPMVVFVTQSSGGQPTKWRDQHWAEVIRAAAARGYAVVYVGVAADAAAIDAIQKLAEGIGTSLAGCTDIPQLAALLAQSDIVITLDTGTMHVARAVGVPIVVLGTSAQKPVEWLPLGLPNVCILRGEDCDLVPEDYCLDEIYPEDVVEAMDEVLVKYPPSASEREARCQRSLSDKDLLVTA